MKQCDDTFFSLEMIPTSRTACARAVRVCPHVCCQVHKSTKVPSLSQQHRQGSHRIPVHTIQHPQVPTFRLVPCPTLPSTISTQFASDEIQRDATKHVFPTTCHKPTKVLVMVDLPDFGSTTVSLSLSPLTPGFVLTTSTSAIWLVQYVLHNAVRYVPRAVGWRVNLNLFRDTWRIS